MRKRPYVNRKLTQPALASQVTTREHLLRVAEDGRARRVYRIAINNGMTVRLARFEHSTRYMFPKSRSGKFLSPMNRM